MSDPVNRRKLSWAEKGGCRVKACIRCGADFKPPTSGNMYCGEECSRVSKLSAHRNAMRVWRAENRERARQVKAAWDLGRYGLTIDDYDRMRAQQNYKCAICSEHESNVGGRGIARLLAVITRMRLAKSVDCFATDVMEPSAWSGTGSNF